MRKSSRARLFSTCLTGAILAAATPSWAQTSDAPTWKPRAELDAQAGKDIGVSTAIWAPLAQNDSGLVYVDGRIGYDQRFDRNGSATIGARVRVGEDAAIGVNVGADFYRSDLNNRDQAAMSIGLEGFTSVFDVRLNYRLPITKRSTISYIDPAAAPTGVLLQENNRLIERRFGYRLEDIPLQGVNGEVGVRLPVSHDASIRGSVGGYSYWDNQADQNHRGIRGGLEMDVEDADSGTRFTFGGTVEHDNHWGTDARAFVRLSIPFGGSRSDRGARPTGIDRQMGDRVRRDYVARSGSRYTDLTTNRFAVDARTGNEFGGFYYVSGAGVTGAAGTIGSPTTLNDAVTRAGTNGVVVALGNAGTISTTGATLATNQYLAGGASSVDVRMSNNSVVQYGLGGTNGILVGTSAATPTVTLGTGSVLRDVTIRGAGVGVAATGVGGFALDRVIIENTGGTGLSLTNTLGNVAITGLTVRGGAGTGVLVSGGSNVSLVNSTIGGGAGAVRIVDNGANLTTALSNLTLSATGGTVLDIDGSGPGTVTVTGLSGITIRGGNGETGGLNVRSATFDANTTTAGIQTVNAGRMEIGTAAGRINGPGALFTDVTGSLSFADLDIANRNATGLRVVNSKVNGFTLTTLDGTIDTVGGTAMDLDPLVIDLSFASVSSAGAGGAGLILSAIQGGGAGGNALTIGTLTISNSGAEGLLILNSTGLVRINGGALSDSALSSVRIGQSGIAGSGGSTNLLFTGAITDGAGGSPIVGIYNAAGTISFTGPITGAGTGGIVVQDLLAGGSVSFGAITLTGTVGNAISLNNIAGSIAFTGLVTISNPTSHGILIGNVPGGVTFGTINLTGLGNATGLDLTGTHGNVTIGTLHIAGTGNGTGINLTGATNAGNVLIGTGSVIEGVNLGVDLTNANDTGLFRLGDGDSSVLGSRITATIPIVIVGLNGTHGTYNFADVVLQGDTTNLTSPFTTYYVLAGASGTGTRNNPGTLAGAEASGAKYIVLLNDPAGGQDTLNAAGAGGSLDLAAGQSLVSFLTRDFIPVSGYSVPANLIVNIGPYGITNPYTGSGAPILTSTTAGAATVNLASNSAVDGVVIRNATNVGIVGSGVSGVSITNGDIGGTTGAIAIADGGAASSASLQHLDLSSSAGTVLSLSGTGAGTLTVSGLDLDIAATGPAAGLSLNDVASGGLQFGTISTGISATGAVAVQSVTGSPVSIGGITVGGTSAGAGVAINGNAATIVVGPVSVTGSAGDGVQILGNSGPVTLGAIAANLSGGDGIEIGNNTGAVTIGGASINIAGSTGLNIHDVLGNLTMAGTTIGAANAGVSVTSVAAGKSVSLGNVTIASPTTSGITLADVDGSVLFGTTLITNPGTAGIVFGAGSAGTIGFGDTDINNLGANRTGVDARNASGNVTFNTLDIRGVSTTGTRGIDMTGATFGTNFVTTDSGVITGVGVGVDLTNAAITGNFRYGDGSNTDADGAASTISAVTPIAITGLNAATGTYNFRDVALTGDTSALTSSKSLYFVKAGASGVGTLTDPGSLPGAEASTAGIVILLNDPAGGQDLLDAASAGGSFDLDVGQDLMSFLGGDTLLLPGGAPANVLLYGVPQGQITNPYAGSGAPILTSTSGNDTVVLGGANIITGVIIQNANLGAGVSGSAVSNITLQNSRISGQNSAIRIDDGGANTTLALGNLVLAASGGDVVSLDGTHGGSLTVTALGNLTIQGGNGEIGGFFAGGVVFDSDLSTAGAQAVNGSLTIGTTVARVGGLGFGLVDGSGTIALSSVAIANAGDPGIVIAGPALKVTADTGSIDTLGSYALLAQDAALGINLASITGDAGVVTLNTSAAVSGRDVVSAGTLTVNGSGLLLTGSGNYTFGNAAITDTASYGVILSGAVNLVYSGNITSSGTASVTVGVINHSGTATFEGGTIDATAGAGLQFIDADGNYAFNGTTTLHGGQAGIHVAAGSSGTFTFGAGTSVTDGSVANFMLEDSDATVVYRGSLSQGLNTDNIAVINQNGGSLDFSQATISATAGAGMYFDNADGTNSFGDVALSNGAGVSIVNSSSGTFSFGNVDITDLGAGQTGADLTGALGNVTFATLDIAGTTYTGSKGIDLNGSTTAANIIINESSTIAGVGIGVDLTNAAITGNFRYGDGSNTDADGAASTISAATPIEITGLNGSVGSYNFADVNLVGDTSHLAVSATTYFVRAGAHGVGTIADPGDLPGAEASGAGVIILLNGSSSLPETLDAADAGGTFDLAAGQSLVAFLNSDTVVVPQGGPSNLILYGIVPGQIVNPFTGSGAPILTTTSAGMATVAVADDSFIGRLVIENAAGGVGVSGVGAINVTIGDSRITGGTNAIYLGDGAGTASVALNNLLLGSLSDTALYLDGGGAGTLTVTQFADIRIAGGMGELGGVLGTGVVFDADTSIAGYQLVSGALTAGSSTSPLDGSALRLFNAEGALALDLSINAINQAGVDVAGGAGGLNFAATGSIDVASGASLALHLQNLTADVQLASLNYTGTGVGVDIQDVTGGGAGGNALDIGVLTVADGATAGIRMFGSATGNYSFGSGSAIGTTGGAAIDLSNTGASNFTYAGNVTYAGADALLHVGGGHSGTVSFTDGTLSATSGTGLQFDDADGSYAFTGTTTLDSVGISIAGGSAGSFSFGTGTTITSAAVTPITIASSTANFSYSGSIDYSGTGDAISVIDHSVGTVSFDTGTINVSDGTGLHFDNADGTYNFTGFTQLQGGDAGLDILNGSGGSFAFGHDTTILSPSGVGIDVQDSTASLTYSGTLNYSSGGAAAINVVNHSGGTLAFGGLIDAGTGIGLAFDNADGTYNFIGSTILESGNAGIAIVNGSSGAFDFGAGTVALVTSGDAITVSNSTASLHYAGYVFDNAGYGLTVLNHSGGTIAFDTGTLDLYGGAGLRFDNADGTYSLTGTTNLGVNGGVAIVNDSSGGFTFGDVDITDFAGGTAVDLTGALGDVTFATLDIAGTGVPGSKGIDLTGNTGTGDIIVNESSAITGVDVGVDLTNASRPGAFRYGDGSNTDADGAASVIDAVTPIAIGGLNGAIGTYNFADVALTGDTSALQTNATLFWVLDGATGAGTRSDPGSIAAAEASGAQAIILLDSQAGAGAFDTITMGGDGTFTLGVGQRLLSFLNGDTATVGGGAPANVTLYGVLAGQVTNPFAGSGAPLLTTLAAGTPTVTLANNALIDGVLIGNGAASQGVRGTGVTGVTIRNSEISGTDSAIRITDGGGTASASFSGLTLYSTTGNVLSLNGSTGTLTVTALDNITILGGNGETGGIFANTVVFDADLATAGIQQVVGTLQIGTTANRIAGDGLFLQNVTGAVDFAVNVANSKRYGVYASGGLGGFVFKTSGGSIDTDIVGDSAPALSLNNVSADLVLSSVTYDGPVNAVDVSNVTGVGPGARALDIGTLTVAPGATTGVSISGTSSGNYSFGSGSSITGTTFAGLYVVNSGAGTVTYAGDITATSGSLVYAGNGHSGTLDVTGTLTSTGAAGIALTDADGTYNFTGTTTLSGTGGIVVTGGSSGTFDFGANTSISGSSFTLAASQANVTYSGSIAHSGAGAAVSVSGGDTSTADFTGATFSITGGGGLAFDNADGTYTFGSLALSGGAGIAVINGSAGTLTFGDVDITGVGAGQTAVDLTGAMGDVTFNTLDITATSASGSTGIDLTGNTGTGNIVVTNSSSMTGLGVGVDLTNANRSGLFQYGDGEDVIDVASSITATTPIVATGLSATGTYNFADVALNGDTSALATSATIYYVLDGASGAGTMSDPGDLSGAELSGANIIVLLNDPAGGQDVLDTSGTNADDSLVLAASQALRSFRDSNTMLLPAAPSNLILTGVTTGQITNPYAATATTDVLRAPLLSTSNTAPTVIVSTNSLVDGVFIGSQIGGVGVFGSGESGVTLSNATIGGGGMGILLSAGGVASSATLTNLNVSSSGGLAVMSLTATGLGTLTLNGSGVTVTQNGLGNLLTLQNVDVAAGGLAFGAVASTSGANGAVTLSGIGGPGALSFASVTAGPSGIALSNASTDVNLGNVTVAAATGTALALSNNSGDVTVGTFNFSGGAYGFDISGTTGALTVGNGTIAGAGAVGINFGAGNSGTIAFGDVDITGVGAGDAGVDLTTLTGGGSITFNTLDISGTSTSGTKGIDLNGNTDSGNFVVTNSSSITGVGIGVDLSNANRTGLFRYGDGEDVIDVASTITATTPLAIAGLNGTTGTYNFADVFLDGDNSNLATSATVYYVLAGASGVGTMGDPGSLAGAEAATADIIVLLNDPAGGQDTIDTAGSNADDSLNLDTNQALRSFRDSNTMLLPGGAPGNLIVTGVVTGQITNPYAGSAPTPTDRAPILTTTVGGANTVNVADGSLIDGVFLQSALGGSAIYGSGAAGVTIINSTISGPGFGIYLVDGGGAASASLTNLTVSASGGDTAILLSGAGAGTLTLDGSAIDVSHSGAGTLLTLTDVDIDAAGLSFGTVAHSGTGGGVELGGIGGTGTLSFGSISTAAGLGVSLHDSSADVNLGNVTVTGAGLSFANDSGDITTGTIGVSGASVALSVSGISGTLTAGNATIVNATTTGIVFGAGNSGTISFGDVGISGVTTGVTGVDATALTGNGSITFNKLNISASSASGSKGIDLSGNTDGGDFIVADTSAIQGVDIGVDLTNANRTGNFQYGDGESAIDVASSITATTPIAIAGLNGTNGSYNFLDVVLTGDTSPLETSAFFVRAGASGVGSAADPGSLAAADASTASYIVLLDTQAGAGSFDTITGTLSLASGQSLLSFRDGDSFNVGGGAPPNVLVYGITTGTINNPNPGSGAPLLTSADATGTVQLGGANTVDGVIVSNTGTGAAVYGSGAAGALVIRNSTLSGGGSAVNVLSAAATLSLNLQNLSLANSGGNAGALLNVDGTGGTLTVTGLSNLTIDPSGGETAGLVFNTVTFDSDTSTAGIQTLNAGALTIGTTGDRVQGDGLSLTNVSGALTFTDLDIANQSGTGLLVVNSKANGFVLTTLDGSVETSGGTAVNLDPLTVNITLSGIGSSAAATYGILLDQVEGSFTVTGPVFITSSGTAAIAIQNNTAQAVPLVAMFDDVFINNTSGTGLSFTNNGGATINFAGSGTGVDVTTTTGAGLVASGGGTIGFAGSSNSIQTGTGTAINLNGITVGAGGIAFGGVSGSGGTSGVLLTNVLGGAINLGTVSFTGITSLGVGVTGTLGTALSFADLDIGLNGNNGVAFDLHGATLSAAITANDFDVTNAGAPGTSIGVDLRGTLGGQIVRLGDATVAGASSSIAGVGTGVFLNATTNAAFVFGDGEATDGGSTISAPIGIDATNAPTLGTYDFRDVTFGASPGNGFGIGKIYFVDSDGATGGGNGSGADGANPMTLAAAEAAIAVNDVIVLINNGNAITSAATNANNTLNLLDGVQVRGFGDGVGGGAGSGVTSIGLTVTPPPTVLLSSTSINIAPVGATAATLTTSAGADAITLGSQNNRIAGFILDGSPAGALRGVVDNGGATGTTVSNMTVRNFSAVGGYGIEITPSTNSTISGVAFSGNTNDLYLNAAGSTISNVTSSGATGTSLRIDNATGTTALTNVSISGGATGILFTTPAGTINAANVDIAGATTDSIVVSGGTASFNFDAASSITQAAGGRVLNFTGNHTTGTFAYAGTINATSGVGMQFNNTDGTYNFTGTTTLNGGDAGIDIYNGATGTFGFGSGTAITHNNAGNAFSLLSSANLTYDGTITDNNGNAIEIDSHDGGTATFNGAISSTGNASTVISIVNSNAGSISFNGAMSLGGTTAAVVSLQNNAGATITFNAGAGGLAIGSTSGTGFLMSGGGTVNVLGSNNSLTTTSGTLLSVSDSATATVLDLHFTSATNSSGTNGITLTRTATGTMTGTVAIAGGSITGTTRGVLLSGDAVDFTYGGQISSSGTGRTVEATGRTGGTATLSGNIADAGNGIWVHDNTGGTVAFTGQTIDVNTGANTGVTLANNTGATVSFAPALGGNGFDVTTTSGTAFSATGGGTLIVTGAGNSIQTATGRVINLTGVSAGTGGINFATLASTGTVAATAINLNNFDGTSFTVTGATSINSTSGAGNDGIFIGGNSAAAITFGATTIGATGDEGVEVNGTGNGAVSFGSVTINGSGGNALEINGSDNGVTISGGSIGNSSNPTGRGVYVVGGTGAVDIAAAITKTNAGNVIEVDNHETGTVTFSGNIAANTAAGGILVQNVNSGTIAFTGSAKTLSTGAGTGVDLGTNNAGGTINFTNGGLGITTTSGTGLAMGGGDVTISGASNTISTATGTGVLLDGGAGTISVNSAITTTGAGRSVLVQNRSGGTATLSGNITSTGGTGTGILVQTNTGGTITFSGTSKALTTDTNPAVTLLTNTGATVNFTNGGLVINTTTADGFTATGGGTVNVSGTGNTITTTTGQIIVLSGVATSSGIGFATLTSGVAAGNAIDINALTGAGTFSGGNVTVAGTSASGDGINIRGSSAAVFTFASAIIGTGANTVAGDGIEINGSGNGAVTFTTVDIDNTTGNGLNIAGAAGATGNIAINGGTIGAGTAPSIGGDGVNITGGSGTITVAATITKTTAGNIVEVNGHTGGTVTFSGNLSATGGFNNGILVTGNTGGTIDFTAGTKTLSTGTSTAVSLTNNTGATINFTNGGLAITTTSGTGFLASGAGPAATTGGTITVQGTTNTISATSGIGLSVLNTTIGAADLTFRSISSGGAANVGISLDNTGSTGGLHVTGNGGAGTGGTIANKTGGDGSTSSGIGIYLNNTADVQLAWMQLNDFSNYAIRGLSVNGFTLANSVIEATGAAKNGSNAAFDEGGISFGVKAGTNGLIGTASVTNTTITDSFEHGFSVYNSSGTLNLVMDNVTINDNGGDGIQTQNFGGATVNFEVKNSHFLHNVGDHFNATADISGGLSPTLNVLFGTNGGNILAGTAGDGMLGEGILVQTGGQWAGTGSADISNNTITFAKDTPINVNTGGPGTFDVTISNNIIGASGVAGSGTINNEDAIRIVQNGDKGALGAGANGGTINALVSNNIIQQVAGSGIVVIGRDGGSAADSIVINVTIIGNTLRQSLTADNNGIYIIPGASSSPTPDHVTIFADIGGAGGRANIFSDDWGVNSPSLVDYNEIRILFNIAGNRTILTNYAGGSTDNAAVIAYLNARNGLDGTVLTTGVNRNAANIWETGGFPPLP